MTATATQKDMQQVIIIIIKFFKKSPLFPIITLQKSTNIGKHILEIWLLDISNILLSTDFGAVVVHMDVNN